jgi:hypothetical protein
VELPKPQPIDPDALAAEPPFPIETPADQGQRPQQTRRNVAGPPAARPESATPPAPTPSTPPATAPPTVETPQPPIQEIVPAAESKRLQEQARSRRAEVQQILDQLGRRQLTPAQKDTVTHIKNFMDGSLEAEGKGDMRQADALADRAQILAKDLSNNAK